MAASQNQTKTLSSIDRLLSGAVGGFEGSVVALVPSFLVAASTQIADLSLISAVGPSAATGIAIGSAVTCLTAVGITAATSTPIVANMRIADEAEQNPLSRNTGRIFGAAFPLAAGILIGSSYVGPTHDNVMIIDNKNIQHYSAEAQLGGGQSRAIIAEGRRLLAAKSTPTP